MNAPVAGFNCWELGNGNCESAESAESALDSEVYFRGLVVGSIRIDMKTYI